jgi:indolepyruvate ferredoxin oxidoreductase
MPLLRLLARAKLVRGTVLDVFGRSEERRMERELAVDYAHTMRALAARLSSDNMAQAVELAGLADGIRGFGPVKLANLRRIKLQERALVHALGMDFVSGPTVARLCEPARGRAALQAISVVKAP